MTFKFLEPGTLIDDDLQLVLAEQYPGDRAKNYVPTYRFRMVHTGAYREMGHIDLRIGDTSNRNLVYGGTIGYGVLPDFRGHRYAARSCRLLLPLARRHGLYELWITVSPSNAASRRTAELAGAELVEIVDLPEDTEMYQEGARRKCRYRTDL